MAEILIVDDEEPVRTLIADALKRQNYLVFTASSGKEALNILGRDWEIDIVICDNDMENEGQGMKVLSNLWDMRHGAKTCLMSGRMDCKRREEAMAVGAEALAKPFTLKELYEMVLIMLTTK